MRLGRNAPVFGEGERLEIGFQLFGEAGADLSEGPQRVLVVRSSQFLIAPVTSEMAEPTLDTGGIPTLFLRPVEGERGD